jgi:DNA primase
MELMRNPEVLDYLRFQRGLTWAAICDAQLGYDAEQSAIVIPYYDGLLHPRALRYRRFGEVEDGQKYWWDPGSGIHLYRVHQLGQHSAVWLTEGEFDALILWQLGLPAIGVPSATGFQKPWAHLFTHTDEVTIVFDGDAAGEEGAKRTASFLASVTHVKIARLPRDHDVNSLFLEDPEELMRRIR